jgi:hypothetical protein
MGSERKKPGKEEIGSKNNQKDKVFRRNTANTEIKILLKITEKEYRKKNRKETKRNKNGGEIARKNKKAQKGGWGKQLAKEKNTEVKRLTNLKKI